MTGTEWEDFTQDAETFIVRRVPCHMCLLMDNLPAEGKTAVEAVLERREISAPAIRTALINKGLKVPSVWSIQRHRRGECRDRR